MSVITLTTVQRRVATESRTVEPPARPGRPGDRLGRRRRAHAAPVLAHPAAHRGRRRSPRRCSCSSSATCSAGAIDTGSVAYADCLIPAMAVTTGLFASGAAGVADDIESGLFDRLRSLPDPAGGDADRPVAGRHRARRLGHADHARPRVRHRLPLPRQRAVDAGRAPRPVRAVFGAAFTWPFIYMGLVAGSSQAAQGMSFMAFPFVFVSSAYVPVDSMPGWMQPVAEHQPVTTMVGAVRSLTAGRRRRRHPRPQHHVVRGAGAGWWS